jgi:hypothetical protein
MSNITAAAAVRKGPLWIVVLAAALVAACVVAVLLTGNFLNRPQPATRAVAAVTSRTAAAVSAAAPSITPTAPSEAAPAANTEAFGCTSTVISNKQAPLSSRIDGLRVGPHAGYDRLTIEFQNGQPGTMQLVPRSGTAFIASPRGNTITVAGTNSIGVLIAESADAHTAYSGPTDIKTGFDTLVEVRQTQDFEGYVSYALGISGPACYHAFVLANPTRLVVDVQGT